MDPKTVTTTVRLVQVLFAVIFAFFCAGVIFGFAALKPVLVKEGIYHNLCHGEQVCNEQEIKLNFMFTLGTTVTNGAALLVGAFLDRFGPFYSSLLGSTAFAIGNFFLGLSSPTQIWDYPLIAFAFLGIGGPLIFFSCFHLSNTFPGHEGLVLSAITGAFDASSLPWVVFRELNERDVVGFKTWFWGYLVVPAIVVIEQLTIAPRSRYLNTHAVSTKVKLHPENEEQFLSQEAYTANSVIEEDQDEPNEQTSLLDGSSAFSKATFPRRFSDVSFRPPNDVIEHMVHEVNDIRGVLWGKTAKQQICSTWFLAIALFLVIHMIRINFYIQTCNDQLFKYTHDAALANWITKAFTYLLPLGGMLGVPFIGFILDHTRTITAVYVLILSGLSLGILTMTKSMPSQVLGIGIFVIFRPLMYTFVSDYSSKVFGFETFGTVYGLANTIAGLTGLVQAPLDVATKTFFQGNYDYVNVGLLFAGFFSSAFLAWRVTHT